MSIAVIIVNYNSGTLLTRCLSCLGKQSRPADKIVIVDNASNEDTNVLDTIADALVIRLDENLGYGAAINLAANNLEDIDFICCLNPDAFPRPGWLEALEQAARAYPSYGSFASLMLQENDASIIDGAGDVLHVSGIPWRRFHGHALDAANLVTEPIFSACAGAAMYRLESFQKVGGFDESFFMYLEDVDLGFRLQLAQQPCLFVVDALVDHIGSAITGKDSDFAVYHGHRNVVWNYFKNVPLLLLLLTLPLHLLMNLITIAKFTADGRGRVICRAKWDAFLKLPALLRLRINARSNPTVPVWPLLTKDWRR